MILRVRRKLILHAALSLSILSATGVGPSRFTADVFAAEKAKVAKPPKLTDGCEPLRKPFSRIKNYQTEKILGGAVKGAFLGVLAAVATNALGPKEYVQDKNGNIRKKGPDIVGGAVAGAVAGGLIGYLGSLEQNRENRAALQGALMNDFELENSQYRQLPQQLADLGNCRNQQIFTVQQQAEAGMLTPQEAEKRLVTLEKWIADDDKLIGKAAKMQGDSIRTYAQAWSVSEGQSAEAVKEQGDGVALRYAGEAQRFGSNVEVTYDPVPDAAASQPVTPAPLAAGPPTRQAWVTNPQGAWARAEASAKGAPIKLVPRGEEIEVSPSDTPGWVSVTIDDKAGFMSAKLIGDQPPARSGAPKKPVRIAKPTPPPTPRPDKAPGKIKLGIGNAQAGRGRDSVGMAIAQKNNFQLVDTGRRTSQGAQLAAARERLRAIERSAQS